MSGSGNVSREVHPEARCFRCVSPAHLHARILPAEILTMTGASRGHCHERPACEITVSILVGTTSAGYNDSTGNAYPATGFEG